MSTIYTVNNKVLKNSANDKWLAKKEAPDYNPLGLPSNTVRVRTRDGNAPIRQGATYDSATLVSGTTDVYDVYKSGTYFTALLLNCSNIVEVLGANTTNITSMNNMFNFCSSLTSVALFDTSSVTNMESMFGGCSSLISVPLFNTSIVTLMSNMFQGCSLLTTVPLFDTSSVTNMASMFSSCSSLTAIPLFDTSTVTNMSTTFYGCTNVQSGALALYQQASSQVNPPATHSGTFYNCGKDTVTGAAELAQIPSSWGGTGA